MINFLKGTFFLVMSEFIRNDKLRDLQIDQFNMKHLDKVICVMFFSLDLIYSVLSKQSR